MKKYCRMIMFYPFFAPWYFGMGHCSAHYNTEGGGAYGPSQEVGRAHLHFQAYS